MGKRQVFNKWKMPWRVIKGDTVYIRTGVEKTKTGVVAQVDRNSNSVIVEGLNLKKKHVKKLGKCKAKRQSSIAVARKQKALQPKGCLALERVV